MYPEVTLYGWWGIKIQEPTHSFELVKILPLWVFLGGWGWGVWFFSSSFFLSPLKQQQQQTNKQKKKNCLHEVFQI